MDRNTKLLMGAFVVVLTYLLVSNVVYPTWIEPMVTIKDRVADRQKELDKLEDRETRVEKAKQDYRRFVNRVGSFDLDAVETAVRREINRLIKKHKLENEDISPNRGTVDRNTRIARMVVTVQAEGSLPSAVEFLRDVSGLAQLTRVGNVTLYPLVSHRKRKGSSRQPLRMNLRVPVEIWVLPQQKISGRKLTEADLHPPASLKRYAGGDYSIIWSRTPFTEYVPLKPLVVRAGDNVNATIGQPVSLHGTAQGGDGEYTYQWTPSVGLRHSDGPTPVVDTSKEGALVFTLTVHDNSGREDSSTVTVTVSAPAPQVVAKPPSQPALPPKPVRKRSRKRRDMQLSMALIRSHAGERTSEVLVRDTKLHESTYYVVGDEFEGGTLVLVHPRGAVVQWEDSYFIYPIGESLDSEVNAAAPDAVTNHPVLQLAAMQYRESFEASKAGGSAVESDQTPKDPQKNPKTGGAAEKSSGARPAKTGGVKEVKESKPGDGPKTPSPPDGPNRGATAPASPATGKGKGKGKAKATPGKAKPSGASDKKTGGSSSRDEKNGVAPGRKPHVNAMQKARELAGRRTRERSKSGGKGRRGRSSASPPVTHSKDHKARKGGR